MRAIVTGVILAAVILFAAYCYGQQPPACPNGQCQVPQQQNLPRRLVARDYRQAPLPAFWWRRDRQWYSDGAYTETFVGPFGRRRVTQRGQ